MLVGLGFHLIAGDLPATVCLRLALKLPRELVASASACERPADGVADQAREALRLVLAVDHGLRHARGEGAP